MLLDDAGAVEAAVLGSWPGPQELGERVPVPAKQLEVAVAGGVFAGLTDPWWQPLHFKQVCVCVVAAQLHL